MNLPICSVLLQRFRLVQTMSFQPPTARQEQQRSKILEDLQRKQQLLKQSAQNSLSSSSTSSHTQLPTLNNNNNNNVTNIESSTPGQLTNSQRTALQHAQNNSFGYFITQDSSFGNLILPVLPRFS